MYKPYVCRVMFKDGEDAKSWRYGVSAGNEYEVIEAIRRKFKNDCDVEVSDIREATPSERASLRLGAGEINLLH